MGNTLKQQAENAQLRKQIAQDKLATQRADKYRQFHNKNLRSSRLRNTGWSVPAAAERDLNSFQRDQATAKARQLVEETPLISGLVQSSADYIVANGFNLNMLSEDESWNREVEMWWTQKRDDLDVRGDVSWGELQRTWFIRHLVDGDVGLNFIEDIHTGFQVQTVEGDRIRSKNANSINGGDDVGIDFDSVGRALRYHVGSRDRNDDSPTITIDAENFLLFRHDFTARVDRCRGVSALLPLFNLATDYQEILDGISHKVKKEAFMGMLFGMEATEGAGFHGESAMFPGGQDLQLDEVLANTDSREHIEMVPGLNLSMKPGETVEILESKSPTSEFDTFEKKLISRIAFPFGLSYELCTSDYSGLTYSAGKAMIEQSKKRWRVEQSHLARVSTQVFHRAINNAIIRGELTPPAISSHSQHGWGRPGWPSLDPLKEASANEKNLALNLTSRSKILAEAGECDIYDIAAQNVKDREVLGLSVEADEPDLQQKGNDDDE